LRAVTPPPLQQGVLDMACGLYAVVNAAWVIRPRAASMEFARKVKAAFTHTDWRHSDWLLSEGLSRNQVNKMLIIASHLLSEAGYQSLEIRRPFWSSTDVTLEQFKEAVLGAFTSAGVAVVAQFNGSDSDGSWSHWTVIRGRTPKLLQLYDSLGSKTMALSKLVDEDVEPVRGNWSIRPASLFVVT